MELLISEKLEGSCIAFPYIPSCFVVKRSTGDKYFNREFLNLELYKNFWVLIIIFYIKVEMGKVFENNMLEIGILDKMDVKYFEIVFKKRINYSLIW